MFVVRYLLFRVRLDSREEVGLASSGRREKRRNFPREPDRQIWSVAHTCHAFHPRT